MRTKKATAFWATFLGLMLMFLGVLAFAPEVLGVVAPGIVAGLVGASASYQGSNVADNFQRAKYYREELTEKGTVQ